MIFAACLSGDIGRVVSEKLYHRSCFSARDNVEGEFPVVLSVLLE